MNGKEKQIEALARARGNIGTMNYGLIFHGFKEKGIAEDQIRPRENIFTFQAWKALGRYVKQGEHGVKITVFVKYAQEVNEEGKVKIITGSSPKTTTVFHVSQTIEK